MREQRTRLQIRWDLGRACARQILRFALDDKNRFFGKFREFVRGQGNWAAENTDTALKPQTKSECHPEERSDEGWTVHARGAGACANSARDFT